MNQQPQTSSDGESDEKFCLLEIKRTESSEKKCGLMGVERALSPRLTQFSHELIEVPDGNNPDSEIFQTPTIEVPDGNNPDSELFQTPTIEELSQLEAPILTSSPTENRNVCKECGACNLSRVGHRCTTCGYGFRLGTFKKCNRCKIYGYGEPFVKCPHCNPLDFYHPVQEFCDLYIVLFYILIHMMI